jgi:hypothetical protein
MKFTNFLRNTKKKRASLENLRSKLRLNDEERRERLNAQADERDRGASIIERAASLGPRNMPGNNKATRKSKMKARQEEVIKFYKTREYLGEIAPYINAEGRPLNMNRSDAIRAAHLKAADAVEAPMLINAPFNMNNPAAALKRKLKKNVRSKARQGLKEKISYYQNSIWNGEMPYAVQEQLLNDPDMDEILQHLKY